MPQLVDAVSRGVLAAGALPRAFPTVSLGEVYLNPLSLMPPWLLGLGPSRLLPLDGPPPER